MSSYGYVIMILHYLQQTNPPVLPCLQVMTTSYPPRYKAENIFFRLVLRTRNSSLLPKAGSGRYQANVDAQLEGDIFFDN